MRSDCSAIVVEVNLAWPVVLHNLARLTFYHLNMVCLRTGLMHFHVMGSGACSWAEVMRSSGFCMPWDFIFMTHLFSRWDFDSKAVQHSEFNVETML